MRFALLGAAACPGPDGGSSTSTCDHLTALLVPIGCGSALDAWISCTASATVDCATGGFAGCDAEQNAYFSCQSQFTQKTSCSRTPGSDSKCSGVTPYAFGCIGSPPQGSPLAPDSGSAATLACCPSFGG